MIIRSLLRERKAENCNSKIIQDLMDEIDPNEYIEQEMLKDIVQTYWLFGLSGAGKTTIGKELVKKIPNCVLLDGDQIRKGINSDLGFSAKDRDENIRRMIEMCRLLNAQGFSAVACFITPYEEHRIKISLEIPQVKLVFINTSLKTCIKRDVKGHYRNAKKGLLKLFTGVGDKFESPKHNYKYVNIKYYKNKTPLEAVQKILS